MQVEVIRGESRRPGGRNANVRLRQDGFVPAVIYGHGEAPEHVALSGRDLKLALERMRKVVTIEIGGKATSYLIKDVQFDHFQDKALHVDLMRVDMQERIRVKAPLDFIGEAKGAKEGGNVIHQTTDIEIECTLAQAPDVIVVNLSDLGLGQSLHARDLQLPEGVTLTHPDEVIASVQAKRGTTAAELGEAAEEGEGGSEPEVIGRGKSEEEGAE